MKKNLTLCIVQNKDKVLLGMKKRGFGEGRWNGFGGKVQRGETIEEATIRELREESGLQADVVERAGEMYFSFEGEEEVLHVHLYRCTRYAGQIHESEEMHPQWFKHQDIPFDEMWPDDRYWVPLFLANQRFRGRFHFKDVNSLLHYNLEVT